MALPDHQTHVIVFSSGSLPPNDRLSRLTYPRCPTRKLIAISLLDVVWSNSVYRRCKFHHTYTSLCECLRSRCVSLVL